MREANRKNILLLGLPETGKTSFLAALYYSASAENSDKTMKEYQMSADSTYLNMIRKQWIGCEKVDRTINVTSTSTRDVVLHLESLKFNQRFDLHIPDIAGESFITQFVDRLWEKSYRKEVNEAGGLLLFIHPARLKHHVLIDDTQFAAAVLGDDLDDVGAEDSLILSGENTISIPQDQAEPPEQLKDETVEFKTEECPTQIVLSDLLQNHIDENKGGHLTIGIVISAWETIIDDENHTPEKWLELNLPLLYQFLSCNFERVTFKVFGVSAQGGNIEDASDVDRLQNCDNPTDRIIVQTAEQKTKDIGIPIEWVIEQWLNETR